jgi:hypothetical protein
MLLALDSGTLEFWPNSLLFGLFTAAISMVFVMPGYLAFAGITTIILKRTRCSPIVRRRWLLGPPLLALAAIVLNPLNNQRPSIGFEAATGVKAPTSLRRFHYAHGMGLMWSRHVAWFEMEPADLRNLVQVKELVATNGLSLHRLLNGDREISNTSIPTQVPESNYSVCYLNLWQEFNFSTRRYLFTTPEHDKAVWVYMHDR